MRARKEIWITAACALTLILATISLKSWPIVVQAAIAHTQLKQGLPLHSGVRAAAQTDLATLRSMAMPTSNAATRKGHNVQPRPILPNVEEFTLAPPNAAAGVNKTMLTVRFPELQAEKLASRIPMMIGSQHVLLQRSTTDPSVFVTSLNFDWQKFEHEQALRKQQASHGKMISVFAGRRVVRTEKMQFLDPAQIEGAIQNHQPIQFTTDILLAPIGPSVYPDHELMMVNTAIVEDTTSPARTYDQCLPVGSQGNPNGPWTFNTLLQNIACSVNSCTPGTNQGQQIAENMLLGMLNSWNQNQSINGFTVLARTKMGVLNPPSGFLGNWPADTNPSNQCTGLNGLQVCPSLPNAPVRLDAIVNRLDLGADPQFPQAGQLRMIFTVTAGLYNPANGQQSCVAGAPFNFIFEFSVPSTYTALTWAQQWASLRDLNGNGTFSSNYLSDLQTLITDQVTKPTSCGGASCLSRIRTNEILVEPSPGQINADLWEQREFQLQGTQLAETTVSMTPDPRFNSSGLPVCTSVNGNTPAECNLATGILESYINSISTNQTFLTTKGAAPLVPNDYPQQTTPFLGGSALNGNGGCCGNAYWNDSVPTSLETARVYFSSNTCNGCHGAETNVIFQQVNHREINHPSGMSDFLLGAPQCSLQTVNLGDGGTCTESVTDPNPACIPTQNNHNCTETFGDIGHRVQYFQAVCGSIGCQGSPGGDLLLSFTNRPIGVH